MADSTAPEEQYEVSGGRTAPGVISSPGEAPTRADYTDAFTIAASVDATAEQWLVACFEEGIPRRDRNLIFQFLAGFNTVPDRTEGHVAGWRLGRVENGIAEMTATGSRMLGLLRLEIVPKGVRLTTAMHYRSLLGRIIWTVCSAYHRHEAPHVLRRGAELLRG